MKKPQFKELTFKSQKEFDKWLSEKAKCQIDLVDFGQDMQRIYVHESGEILHCDFQESIYNGKFVDNIDKLEPGTCLVIDGVEMGRLIIEQIYQ